MPPRMFVVAGPPGSGKSSVFPVASFGSSFFNADDRAAELNHGSYVGIPKHFRQAVNREFEAFVLASIRNRTSFAIETTLRSGVTFEQVSVARAAGFATEMRFLALRDFAMHLDRVKARADAGAAIVRQSQRLGLSTEPVWRIFRELSSKWTTYGSTTTHPSVDRRDW